METKSISSHAKNHSRRARIPANSSKPLLSQVRNSKVSKAIPGRSRPGLQLNRTTQVRTYLLRSRCQGYRQGQEHGCSNDSKPSQDCPENPFESDQAALYNDRVPKPAVKLGPSRLTRSSGVSKAATKSVSISLKQKYESSRSSGLARRGEQLSGNKEAQMQLPSFGTNSNTLRRSKRSARKCSIGYVAADQGRAARATSENICHKR